MVSEAMEATVAMIVSTVVLLHEILLPFVAGMALAYVLGSRGHPWTGSRQSFSDPGRLRQDH